MKDEDWIEATGSAACSDCRFYDAHWGDDEIEIGGCQRFPPKDFDRADRVALWPTVRSNDWCGEFELDQNSRLAFEAERLARWQGQLK